MDCELLIYVWNQPNEPHYVLNRVTHVHYSPFTNTYALKYNIFQLLFPLSGLFINRRYY